MTKLISKRIWSSSWTPILLENSNVKMLKTSLNTFRLRNLVPLASTLQLWSSLPSICHTADIYIKECLKKRLLPFIKSHNTSTFFWPNLASIHYSKNTVEWYKQNKVNFVPKLANLPNCSKEHPIKGRPILLVNCERTLEKE